MLAPSKRQVTPAEAADMVRSIQAPGVNSVGVVVNLDASEANALRHSTSVDIIQLSGNEGFDILNDLDGRVWKAFRFPAGTSLEAARRQIDPWLTASHPVEAVLLDASVAGAFGGTGHRADWELAARLSEGYPLILAGGLTPDNVSQAISLVQPFGVDVSSGVERDGVKDAPRIREFTQNAATAFAGAEVSSLD
jgi:phosphoribosylanthranilate isomerase